ncbi:MAG: GspH/FimT family pseudopilin [Candidatus Competibacteraceae bacterium]
MNRQCGFTLTELIITVAIAAIVIAIGVPAFQDTMRSNRMVTHTNDFIGSLNLARSEAIKRGRRVALCKSTDGAACTNADNWEKGWIVFVDVNNNAAVDAGEVVIRAHGPLDGDNTLKQEVGTSVSNYISYSPDGFTRLINGAFQAGTLSFDLCSGGQKNEIILSSTGRARLRKVSCP